MQGMSLDDVKHVDCNLDQKDGRWVAHAIVRE